MTEKPTPLSVLDRQQKAEWTEPLCPWTSVACLVYSAIALIAEACALLMVEIGPRWENPCPKEVWHSKVAILLVFSAFITEMCFMASSATNAMFLGFNLKESLQLHRFGDSLLTLTEYAMKIVPALYMGLSNGGVIHTDTLAWGGPRPVYHARFWQWALSVPVLILISNRSFFRTCTFREMATRCTPCVIAAFSFCWAAWVMEVTTSPTVRWIFLVLSLSGAVTVSTDQLYLAYTHRHDELFGWKMAMLIYQLVSFAFYASLFLSGRFGLYSSLTEQTCYAYCDATVKLFQGAILAMIRNRQDLDMMRSWWVAALAAGRDLDNVIQLARIPILSVDLKGRIVEWNNNLVKLTGMELDEVKGKMLSEIASAACSESVEQSLASVLREARGEELPEAAAGAPSNFVEIAIMPSGDGQFKGSQPRQLAMTLVPKSVVAEGLPGVVAIGQDLSDFADLKIAQDRKTALLAMLSHEIRSPLHGILGLSAAMLESEAGKGIKRQLGMVKGCAARLLDMVTNIMDLAQHEKRKKDGNCAVRPNLPVNFSAIANEVTTMTDMAVDKMNKSLLKPAVRLVNNLANLQVPLIAGDPPKCTQLLYNLVTNACKFTERGRVSISARYDQEQNVLEIDITDTGKGISKEGQKRIFQAFEQEQNGDTRSFQGIGLGLAVCTEIMELHGGHLRVVSELGKGSTFTACFPCDGSLGLGEAFDAKSVAAPPPKMEGGRAGKGEGQEQDQQLGRPVVLSVDDDEASQEVVRLALGGICEVHQAMDGEQAVKFLEGRRARNERLPAAVLLDIQMPGVDGFYVCEKIRHNIEADHSKMPIIMISAKKPSDQTAIQSYGTGATDFVSKPFNQEVLRRKMMVVLKARNDMHLGASTTAISKEAAQKLTELQAKLAQERAKANAFQVNRDEVTKRSQALQGEIASSKARAEEMKKEVEASRLKLNELEQKRQQLRQKAPAARAPPPAVDADSASRDAALAAEREGVKKAEALREQAERKARELSETAQQMQEKLQRQDTAVRTDVSPAVLCAAPLPVDAIKTTVAASISAMAVAGKESDAGQAMERQHQIIGSLLRHAVSARAVVRALVSRVEISNALVRGCFDLLRIPMVELSANMERLVGADYLQKGEIRMQVDGFVSVAQIVTAQISLLEQVSLPALELTSIADFNDAECAEFSGVGRADAAEVENADAKNI